MADNMTRLAFDHQHKRFGRHAGVGVQQAKLVTTRLPKLHIGSELTRLVRLRGQREVQPLASLPALHAQKGVCSTVIDTLDSNGLERPGGVGYILQLNGLLLR